MAPSTTGWRTVGRGFPRRNKGQSKRDYLLGTTAKTGDSDAAVPLLKFGAKNNWLKFKEKLHTACVEKYGDLGRLLETEEYFEPKEIDANEYPNW